MKGIFGSMFDFNHDGQLNAFERGAEFAFMDEMMQEDAETDFEMSGLDADELEFMDPEERRQTLEDAGLDPDDYDF